jgi:hypothetical protein
LSDVNANIGIVFDSTQALASLRQLQAGLSKFNQALTAGNVNAANAQKGLNDQLVQSINATGKFVASQKTVATSTTAFTDALEKNKLSMGEYFRYTAAAATANTKVLKNAFTAERDIINRARKDRVKALQSQYIQLTNANGELVKVLQVVPKHLEMVNGKYTDYATKVQMAAQRQQLMNQLLKQGSTQLLNFGKNTQWAGRQLMVGLTVPLTMLGSFAAKTFRDMEMAVVKFSRVYGDMFTSNDSTNKAIEDIKKLGMEFTKYGIAVKDTMTMAADAAAMGLVGADLQAQVSAATKLAVLGQVTQAEALQTTISLQNAFGISADQLAKKINFLNAVENQTVLSIGDLTTAIPKAGPVVKQLGGSVEDLAFFMTAMKEGGINASEGANALKSGLAAMINPSKKASDMLASLGVNIKGIVSANAGDLKGTVVGFARALDTLDPLNRAKAIEQLFGKFQFARLSTLFQNITKDGSQASRTLGLAGASVEELAILSERELGKVENAVGVKFQKTIEQLKVSLLPVGKAFLQALTPVLAFVGKILERFNNFSDGTKKAIAIVIGVVGGLAPVALMTFGLLANGLANIIKFFAMLRGGMAKLNGQNSVLGGGFDYLTQKEIENITETNALHMSHKTLIETFNVEAGAANLLANAYANAASQARALAASSPGLFNAVPGASGAVSGLPKFADGGVVPGTGNKDTVPAMLTPGEVVLTKDTVKTNPQLVSALMNRSVKKYGTGTGQENNFPSLPVGLPQRRASATSQVWQLMQQRDPSLRASSISADIQSGSGSEAFKKRMENLINGAMSETETGLTRIVEYAKKSGVDITKTQTDSIKTWRGKMLDAIDSAGKAITAEAGTALGGLSRDQVKNMLKNQPVGPGIPVTKSSNIFTAADAHGSQSTAKTFAHTSKSAPVDFGNLNKMLDRNTKAAQGTDAIQKAADYLNNLPEGDPNKPKRNINPRFTPVSGSGISGITQATNKDLDLERAKVDTVVKELENLQPIEKWSTTLENGGAKIANLTNEITHFDTVFNTLLTDLAKVKTVMGDKDLEKLKNDALSNPTVDPRIKNAMEKSANNITANRLSNVTGKEREQLQNVIRSGKVKTDLADPANFIVPKSGSAIAGEGTRGSRIGVFSKQVDADLTNAERIAQTASPSKRTKKLGEDIGKGLENGLAASFEAVHSQASKLAEAAVPSRNAAQTADKVSKMDLGNKAFYDDINTPEMKDQRQVLKSLDRRRRKLGASGKVNLNDSTALSSKASMIISSNKKTEKTSKIVETQTKVIAATAEDQANAMGTLLQKTQESSDHIKTSNDSLSTNNDNLISTTKLNEAITGNTGNIKTQTANAANKEQQLNDLREQEISAKQQAVDNAKQAFASSNIPSTSQSDLVAGDVGFIGPLTPEQMAMKEANIKAQNKLKVKQARSERRMKVGKYSGKASGALGTAAMVAGMAGAPPQVTAALGTASMVASMAPALAGLSGPQGVVAVLAASALALKMWNDHLKSNAAAQAKYIQSITATTEKMQKLSELTGKVGASELMAKRREGGQIKDYNLSNRAGMEFGGKFVQSDIGKQMVTSFTNNMQKVGAPKAAQSLALELGAYISDGILTAEQANSIASQIGTNLGDYSVAVNIQGQLRMLVGPGGNDILKNPIEARVNLVNQQGKSVDSAFKDMYRSAKQGNSGRTEAAQITALGVQTAQLAQAQSDAVSRYYDDLVRAKEAEIAATTNKEKQIALQKDLNALVSTQESATSRMNVLVAKTVENQMLAFGKLQTNEGGFSSNILPVRGMYGKTGRESAGFDAVKSMTNDRYKGTEFETQAKTVMAQLAKISDKRTFLGNGIQQYGYEKQGFKTQKQAQQLEYKVDFLMSSGILNPQQASVLFSLFEGKLPKMSTLLDVAIKKHGAGKVMELTTILNMMSDTKSGKTLAQKLLVSITKKDPAEFDKTANVISQIAVMDGNEINMEVFLKTIGSEGLTQLATDLDKMSKVKTPITKEVIQKYAKDNNMPELNLLADDWERYANLPPEVQKDAFLRYKTLYQNEYEVNFADENARLEWIDKYAKKKATEASNGGSIGYLYTFTYQSVYKDLNAKSAAELARKAASDKLNAYEPTATNVNSKDGKNVNNSTGQANPLDFLDALAMRIKNVRDGAFDATKPLKSMMAAFTGKEAQKDVSKMFTLFDGLQQRMLSLNVPKEFRDMIMDMSAADFKAFAALPKGKNMFTYQKDKNGKELPRTKANISGLTKEGQAVMQTYREAQVGEYQLVQKEVVASIKEQETAFKILVSSGMSAAEAMTVVEDKSNAAAIAAGAVGKKGSKEMNTFIEDIKIANDALSVQTALNKARSSNAEFAIFQNAPILAKNMKDAGYNAEQIQAALDNPDIAKYLIEDLKDGAIAAGDMKDYIDSIAQRQSIDIRIGIASGDIGKVTDAGRSLVDEMFSVQEALIRTGSKAIEIKTNNLKIADLEQEIAPFQKTINDINQAISDNQRTIELSYTRPIEVLQGAVDGLDRQLETSPIFGNRLMEKIQAQNAIYSNDLSVISHEADKINTAYDKQLEALNQTKTLNDEIIAQQGRQLGLADALTQGDISAAAKAAQDIKAANAASFANSQTDALNKAKANALGSLKGPQSGMTQLQIEEAQYQNAQTLYAIETNPARVKILADIKTKQDEIYALEQSRKTILATIQGQEDNIYEIQQKSILPLQKQIDALVYKNTELQASIDKEVSAIKVLGKNRDAWEEVNAKIDAAKLASKNLDVAFAGLLTGVTNIDKMWTSILEKIATYAKGVPASVTTAQTQFTDTTDSNAQTGNGADAKYDQAAAAKLAADNAAKAAILAKTSPVIQAMVKSGNINAAETATVSLIKDMAAVAPLTSAQVIAARKQSLGYLSRGGMVPKYFAAGGHAIGSDTVQAMLTPGEFVMSKYAVQSHGLDTMKAINNGSASLGDSVYNYNLSVNVKSDANPNEIAQAVMTHIKSIDSQRIRGSRI